ncbi:MAG: CDP-alcohol phosphatidyltransferase family protein [Geminicoccaceae bacterium]
MLDPFMRRFIDGPLTAMGKRLHALSIRADTITWAGFVFGFGCMVAIATGHFMVALMLLIASRLADGLDGAVARIDGATDLGGFLDITLDFIFYSGFVFAFALYDPGSNALAASFLVFSFIGTASSFLAFAIMAARRGLSSERRGRKSFYYLGGLTEATETLTLFIALCIWPDLFAWAAWLFGMLCWLTTAGRIVQAIDLLDGRG